MVAFIVIVSIVIVLVIDYFVSKTFQEIAIMKGHSADKYFWFCFFLGIVGYLMVVALPAKVTAPVEAPKKVEAPVSDELPEI
jgi:hypothetical protein